MARRCGGKAPACQMWPPIRNRPGGAPGIAFPNPTYSARTAPCPGAPRNFFFPPVPSDPQADVPRVFFRHTPPPKSRGLVPGGGFFFAGPPGWGHDTTWSRSPRNVCRGAFNVFPNAGRAVTSNVPRKFAGLVVRPHPACARRPPASILRPNGRGKHCPGETRPRPLATMNVKNGFGKGSGDAHFSPSRSSPPRNAWVPAKA